MWIVVPVNSAFAMAALVGFGLGTVVPPVLERAGRVLTVLAIVVFFGAAMLAAPYLSGDAVIGFAIGTGVAVPAFTRRALARHRPIVRTVPHDH